MIPDYWSTRSLMFMSTAEPSRQHTLKTCVTAGVTAGNGGLQVPCAAQSHRFISTAVLLCIYYWLYESSPDFVSCADLWLAGGRCHLGLFVQHKYASKPRWFGPRILRSDTTGLWLRSDRRKWLSGKQRLKTSQIYMWINCITQGAQGRAQTFLLSTDCFSPSIPENSSITLIVRPARQSLGVLPALSTTFYDFCSF